MYITHSCVCMDVTCIDYLYCYAAGIIVLKIHSPLQGTKSRDIYKICVRSVTMVTLIPMYIQPQ